MSINTKRIHLEGFGLQGTLIAHQLTCREIEFTWSDNNSAITAWKASTGCIYPSGSTKFGPDMACHSEWSNSFLNGDYGEHLVRAQYVYCTKHPPHEGKYLQTETAHGLHIGEAPSFHFNSQSFVEHMRDIHRASRRYVVPENAVRVIAHGFSPRMSHVYWGWTVPVLLTYDRSMYGETACFYFRPNRYTMAYAYPRAGTPNHYAGSSIIKQRTPKELSIMPKFERWKRTMLELANGALEDIQQVGAPVQGWRPAVAEGDAAWAKISRRGTQDVVLTRPLWNNGIRHFPMQWHSLHGALRQLGVL